MIIDLTPELARLVEQARSDSAFRAAYWAWLDGQHDRGPLAPMLHDFTHLWAGTRRAPTLAEARETVARAKAQGAPRRAEAVFDRFHEVVQVRPDVDVVLVVGLGAPEGYSRFDRGKNTIFVGLDHRSCQAHVDHLEVILAHELTHAVRDPTPEVLRDHGGWPDMGHDDFVSRYPFREHLVSEALAVAVSEAAYPGKGAERYIYFDPPELAWCEAHKEPIAARMRRALQDGEDYRTFYRENVIAPGAPACCDYWLGMHLGRFMLGRGEPAALLRTPARELLARHLEPCLEALLPRSQGGDASSAGGEARTLVPGSRTSGERIEPHTGSERRAEALAEKTGKPSSRLVGLSAAEGLQLPEAALFAPAVQEAYRDLTLALANDPATTAAAAASYQRAVGDDGLVYAGEAYDVNASPLLLGPDDVESIGWTARRVMRLVEKVVDLYLEDPDVRAYFGFPPALEALILADPGYRRHVPVSRFDSFWDGRRLRFLELNTNGTAGMPLAERIAALYADLPPVKALLARHRARPFPVRQRLLDSIVASWREARGASKDALPGRIAIVDFAGVPTEAEFHLLARFFTSQGVPAAFCDPRELTYEGGALRAKGEKVDVIYRRLTTLDFLQPHAALRTLERAYVDGSVVMVGSFRSDVAHSKKLFAFLTDERFRHRFTHAERAVIDAHVPWTRVLREEQVLWNGRLVDLVEAAVEHRDQLILKPATSFEGRGVMLGAETPEDRWAAEVRRMTGGTHILQERVAAPVRTFVLPDETGRVRAVPLHLHLGEYVFHGRLAGFQAWASEELVIGVRSSERAVPCFELGPAP